MGRAPSLIVNASRTRGIGPGFVLDFSTLKSYPLSCRATWMGDRLVPISSFGSGRFSLGKRPIAKGWYVLGLSHRLDLALVCRKEPFDGDPTYLLRLNPNSRNSRVLAAYPNSSDDHNWLCSLQEHRRSEILVHSLNLAGDFTQPYFAGAMLRPIVYPVPKSFTRTSLSVEWVSPTSTWMVVRQKLVQEGLWIDTLDLWNPKSKRSIRLAKATMSSRAEETTPKGQSLGPAAVDLRRHRITYILASSGVTQVVIHRLPRLSP